MTSLATLCRTPDVRATDVTLARATRAFALAIAGTFVLASAMAAEPNAGTKRPSRAELRKQAEAGASDACFLLADACHQGLDGDINLQEAAKWYAKAAATGNVQAMTRLGAMYLDGNAVEQNDLLALNCFREAADLGGAEAMNYLAIFYAQGRGVMKDFDQAMQWLSKGAKAGDPAAMLNLADALTMTVDAPEKQADAKKWYSQALAVYQKGADAGNPEAVLKLGTLYEDGRGVSADPQKAATLYAKAAGLGSADAMVVLGSLYLDGKGVPQDHAKCLERWTKAAQRGQT